MKTKLALFALMILTACEPEDRSVVALQGEQGAPGEDGDIGPRGEPGPAAIEHVYVYTVTTTKDVAPGTEFSVLTLCTSSKDVCIGGGCGIKQPDSAKGVVMWDDMRPTFIGSAGVSGFICHGVANDEVTTIAVATCLIVD